MMLKKAGQEKDKVKEPKPKKEKDADTVALEKRLTDRPWLECLYRAEKEGRGSENPVQISRAA